MNRRSFLGYLAVAPVVAPLAAIAAKPESSSAFADYTVTLEPLHGYAGGVSWGHIVDGTITAEAMSVGSLSAISADIPSATPWS